ncbi:amidohydrolase family protein [Enteractinococcus coprophilus]|uniref:2-pyrone-4,6-dicarboxylate hydrolase n=1 Tax=Enteractinococcus coprophilus TaxID=1027633 RepID=A0A543ANY2_9MICC|nr:amidohydrolase family protein [Enteractinococcus coprophilus]TQL74279.1 2-pyrone-4,6-dicarboxylate hydrolase [Enteractinococcus coprophilus]
MTEYTAKTPGWLDWVQNRQEPAVQLPAGTVDSHCHVFGPTAAFPFAPGRKYTPGDASKFDLEHLRSHLGVARNVIVQASCHGRDNAALLDALDYFGDTARGVIAIGSDVSQSELESMHQRGVRGVRFNFVKRLVEHQSFKEVEQVAAKIRELGWHIVVYFESSDLLDLENFLANLGVPLVIDHLGRPDVATGASSAEYSTFLKFVERTEAWVKVSCPERLTITGPYATAGAHKVYTDVAPFAQKAIAEFPERVLWGTDWPHPNLRSHMPDDAVLLNYLMQVAPDASDLQRLLVDNPMTLYWDE